MDEVTGEKPKLSQSTGMARGPGKPGKGDVVWPRTMAQGLKEGKTREASKGEAKDAKEGGREFGTSAACGSAVCLVLNAFLTKSKEIEDREPRSET